MMCPHCGNEIYSQAKTFNFLNNGAVCNGTSFVPAQSFNVNLAAGCNPTIAYPVSGTVKFRYDVATGDMTQMQEEK